MNNTVTREKAAVLAKAAEAVGGKPVCDPKAPCQSCRRADLQLLVVLPSVGSNTHKEDIERAGHAFSTAFDKEFAQMERKATLPVARIMKQGFVYVFYVERMLWDVWQVAESGLTRKIMHQVNTMQYALLQPGFSGALAAKSCSRGAANVPAQLISITGALSAKEVWLAYSADAWTSHTLQRYADNPDVEMPGPGYATVTRKLREVRGRQINATNAAEGKLQPFSLPLNAAALAHNVLDFVSTVRAKVMDGCHAVRHPMDPVRCGMAVTFENEVRALERALGQGLKNREQYVNTTVILMLQDALGVAEAHTHINARTVAERQAWEAGGPDATGMNKNPDRPWQRQSVLQTGFIRDWVAAAEKRKAEVRWGPSTSYMIEPAMYQYYMSVRGTERRAVPDNTRYEYHSYLKRYKVYLPPDEKQKRIDADYAAATKKRIARYEKHLNMGAIDDANKQWKDQENAWIELKKLRDQDYIDWLQTAAFGAAVRYDFDDHRAISNTRRSVEQIRVDAREAATRLRVMARCFGGAGCSEISQDYFARQFRRDITDPTHYIAQALMGEFNFVPKLIDKAEGDPGVYADIYDAFISANDGYKEFAEVWQAMGPGPISDISSINLMAATINARLTIMALQPGMNGQTQVVQALQRATQRSAMWVRSAGLLGLINENKPQYAFSVALGENALAGAIDDTIRNPTTLRQAVVNVDLRPDTMTGNQAVPGRHASRKEIRKHVLAVHTSGLKKVEATSLILCDQDDLLRIAARRGEQTVAVVSPGLFGLNRSVTNVPESWAREMLSRQKHGSVKNLNNASGYLNGIALILQFWAFTKSCEDVVSKGGYDQMDAIGSLLGSLTGVAGGVMELGSLYMTPGALNKMGTPFAAELAAKVPAHLWLKLGAGLCLAAGSVFDAGVAYAKFRKTMNQGDQDASRTYLASAAAQFFGGASLGAGAFFAYRASQLDRLSQNAARQAVVRIFGGAFSPLMLARCLTGVGLFLWLGGLGCSFLALYLEDDDNEVFLRRSFFGKGHRELGRFESLEHEVTSFGSLSMGTRAEMKWEDKLGQDALKVIVKIFKPEPSVVVTVRLQGFDEINGKFIRDLTAGALPPLKLSGEAKEAAAEVFATELDFTLPDNVSAVKLTYYVYPSAVRGTQAVATGTLWVED